MENSELTKIKTELETKYNIDKLIKINDNVCIFLEIEEKNVHDRYGQFFPDISLPGKIAEEYEIKSFDIKSIKSSLFGKYTVKISMCLNKKCDNNEH